ncbi:MAG TPA: hypothetical protein VFJ51_07395 [Nitrososphaeraceae archaeon]|nr:hypothetical protein [Nitrososphaeraceae archaeon]
MEVTSEEVHDGKILKKLVDNASANNNLKGILADGMYDSITILDIYQRTTLNLV